MEFSAKQTWWFSFLLVAVQGISTLAWNTLGVSDHTIAVISQISSYVQLLLLFVLHGSVPGVSSTDPVKKVIAWFLVPTLVLMTVLGTRVEAAEVKNTQQPHIVGPLNNPPLSAPNRPGLLPCDPLRLFPGCVVQQTQPASDLVAAIQKVVLSDLKQATADAKAVNDEIASSCYDAWITLIEAQQSILTPPPPVSPGPLGVVVVPVNSGAPAVLTGTEAGGVITKFQRTRDVVNSLRAGSPIKVACAPLAEELKQDVISLLGKIATGAIGASTLIPLIP
jgi:hypothetical protein